MELFNPYAGTDGPWLKGQLHLHTTNSDGDEVPREAIADYERRGYDFIALTDHNVVPSPEDLAADTAMVLKPAHAQNYLDLKVLEIICKPRVP